MTTLSLAVLLAESAKRTPDRVAVVEGELRLTYGELWADVLQRAGELTEAGVRPGTRVALLAPNVADFVRSYYAILAAGGVVVPVPTLLSGDEAAHIVATSGARLLVCDTTCAQLGEAVVAATGIHQVGAAGRAGPERPAPLRTYAHRRADDPAVVFFTSGTTGRPKGAVLNHLNLVMNATVNAFDANAIAGDDVVVGCLPLFHTFGQTVAMNATFRVGAALVLQPRFDPETAIDLMVREGATAFFGVPTMYTRLLEAAERRTELPRLEMCVSGGASLPVAVLERFEKVFDTTVYEGYGLSETSPTATVNQPVFGTRAGTVGHPVWGVEVEVADADVEDRIVLLDDDRTGEIVVRGHCVFDGYLDDPEATAAVLVDGWFRTGDIGTKDAAGFVTIVDRKKDMIIRGGFNVYPREVEEALARHPGVAQAAVVGLPDDDLGEEVCAVVVPHPDAELDPQALTDWSRERLGGHKYPRHVRVVAELPLGPSHKVLKRELRRQLTQDPSTPGVT